ncbi:MAG: hypothetical protein KDK66_09560, partial [Deltaproteobacteria bacterium]|nr:hypothetical protein [Deltaproteobacteria bacterium]
MKKTISILSHLFFWSWNLIFFSVIYFGAFPILLEDWFKSPMRFDFNGSFIFFFLVLFLMPLLSLGLGFWKLRKDPKKLLMLLYGFELPILILSFFRIFILRELTSASVHLLFCLGIGILVILFFVFSIRLGKWADLVFKSLLLWSGVWLTLFLVFFVPPGV